MAGKKIGVDLGTANSIVAIIGRGIVLEEPTVVAVAVEEKKVLAYGLEAKEMLGKVPGDIVARRPMQQGVIASYKLTEAFLKTMLNRVLGRARFMKPEIMISVPAGITSVEERAVIEAAVESGAGKVYLIPEPLAAAVGADLPVSTSAGNMIVNMGGGTSEIAVISMNGIVTYESKRTAGDSLNDAVINYVRKKHNLIIGEQMAEQIKMKIGSAKLMDKPLKMEVRGREASTGLPSSIKMNSNEAVEALTTVLNDIVRSIKSVLENTPPELASDIIDRGMVLTGGTSQLRYIDELFTKALGVPAHVAEEPKYAVINGINEAFKHLDVIRRSLKEG